MSNYNGYIDQLVQNGVDMDQLRRETDVLRFKLLGSMTAEIYDLAKAGKVNLSDTFAYDAVTRGALSKELRQHLGIEVTKGMSAAVRTIISVTITKCVRVALYLIENKVDPGVVHSPDFVFVKHMAEKAQKSKPDTRIN